MKKSIIQFLTEENHIFPKAFEKKFRYSQLKKAIFQNYNFNFGDMTNLPLAMREYLTSNFNVLNLIQRELVVSNDKTEKYLFQLEDNNFIESVVIYDKNARRTFCISTQVGCRMGCKFCQTGKMGLIRNLQYSEIVSQILFLAKATHNKSNKLFNIVFMGMGEPLDNFDEVVTSIKILTRDDLFNISLSRITVSTCGLIKQIHKLTEIFNKINIAVSLNSAIQKKRANLMPISKTNKLDNLISELKSITNKYKNRITLEYVLIEGVNNLPEDLNALCKLPKKYFHINVIPLNKNDQNYNRPSEKETIKFVEKLKQFGFTVTMRYRKGEDINAACGQLYSKY